MQQSVIYQKWKEEFLQEGHAEGRQEGRQEGEQSLILRLLNRRIGDISSQMEAQIQSLPLEALEALGEALLDFTSLADLEGWFANQE